VLTRGKGEGDGTGRAGQIRTLIMSGHVEEEQMRGSTRNPGPNQLVFWTRHNLSGVMGRLPYRARARLSVPPRTGQPGANQHVILGTVWGPHVMRNREQRARRGTSFDTRTPRLSCGNGYPSGLGVKGSQVQILSARRLA
jgi:hypothetical protein